VLFLLLSQFTSKPSFQFGVKVSSKLSAECKFMIALCIVEKFPSTLSLSLTIFFAAPQWIGVAVDKCILELYRVHFRILSAIAVYEILSVSSTFSGKFHFRPLTIHFKSNKLPMKKKTFLRN
jgi:hypothetical protein